MSSSSLVFDTNTLVSALLFTQSTPGRAFARAPQHGNVLLSSQTLAELTEVLGQKKFRRYVTADEVETFLTVFVKRAVMLEPDATIVTPPVFAIVLEQ